MIIRKIQRFVVPIIITKKRGYMLNGVLFFGALGLLTMITKKYFISKIIKDDIQLIYINISVFSFQVFCIFMQLNFLFK